MRQSFKVSFYLRSNYENKEGKSPVMLRIFLGGAMSNTNKKIEHDMEKLADKLDKFNDAMGL